MTGRADAAGGNSGPAGARLVGVDATRGLALLGMMAIHVLPAVDADGTTSTAYLLASGRSAATFAVLAGVGLALATGGRRLPSGRAWTGAGAGSVVRASAIGAVGLALGTVDSGVAVILPYYALLFVLAVPLLGLGPRVLAVAAVVGAVLVPVASHLVRDDLPRPSLANPTVEMLASDPGALLVELAVTGYYPALAWTAYLCAGLAAGRLPLRSPRVAAGLLAGGLALALSASAASWALLDVLGGQERLAAVLGKEPDALERALSASQYGTTPTQSWWWLAVDSPHSSTPFDLLHTTGVALALLGGGLLLSRVLAFALVPLAAAGSMTLTVYTAHVLLLASPFLPQDPVRSYAVQVVAALVVAAAWRSTVGRGPLEALVAALAGPVRRTVASSPGRSGARNRG